MKNGWQTKKLGDLCEIELGKTPARANKSLWDEKRKTDNVWLSIADLLNAEDNVVVDNKEYLSDKGAAISKIVRKGTLLVSFKLTLGRLAFAGCDLFTNEAIAALTIFNERELSKEFLFYFLHFFDWRKAAENDVKLKGMTLNKAKLKEMPVPFPSPADQQRIVGILDEAFEGIATAKANAEKNLRNARALFESHLQSVFTQRGAGWVEKRLGDLSRITYGYTESASADKVGPNFLRITDIQNNRVDWSSVPYCAIAASEYRKYRLADGDIVFARTGATTGKSYLVTDPPAAVFASYLIRVQLSSPELLPPFVNLFFQSQSYWDSIRSGVSGSAQGGFNATKLGELLIPFPRASGEQQAIVAQFDALTAEANAWRDRFAVVPFEDKGGSHPSRYYQDIAVERTMEAIAENRPRILLTLATGTGKTFIAFQVAWKLFHSRWNLSREPSRRPRILFLADRNILANQAYNAFSAFPEDAMVRIAPEDIRKKGKVPKNGSLFFTIFQTFMSGQPKDGHPSPYFGEYPPDFFDFIVIDECHRGGANDESNWRGILEYFAPAVQLGLTATPKRKDNVDTYAYFGKPVYIYSLKEGINDGSLTPFKVKQIFTTLDEYVYTPDDTLIEGEVEAGKRYTETDFNKIIEIKEREAHRVKLFMDQINQKEKALVFCATQDHALAVRDLVNQMKTSKDPNHCQRVTANDGDLGDQHLREFQDNEKTIPTILTTSQKLSTGVDARNIRNIVLMRPINSMIEFKQIIGRGTRLYDGKDYFMIYDFVKAHHHFSDPEWDGEPIEPEAKEHKYEARPPDPPEQVDQPTPEYRKRQKIKVKLADGKARTIQHMMCTTFWHPDGTPMSAQQFMEMLFGRLPEFFKNEAELRALWSAPETRKKLLQGLAEKGFGGEQLAEMQKIIDAEKSDLFDVLAHVAYALPPLTREERAAKAKVVISTRFNSKQQVFLDFVLSHYVSVGVEELDQDKLTPLLRLKYHNSIADAVADLGRSDEIGRVFAGFQKYLYQQQAAA